MANLNIATSTYPTTGEVGINVLSLNYLMHNDLKDPRYTLVTKNLLNVIFRGATRTLESTKG